MIAVRLPKELENKLEKVASATHRSKSYYIRKALEQFLEDKEDYLLAVARLEERNTRIPYEKIREELGLEESTPVPAFLQAKDLSSTLRVAYKKKPKTTRKKNKEKF